MKELQEIINSELHRQQQTIELIASENLVSKNVMIANGSVLTNKYAEGYPSKRYYGGTEEVDKAERLAIAKAKELFDVKYVNVQPHSGSQANQAAYQALIKPNDTVLAMSLTSGGHLTHGLKVNQSGKTYKFVHYDVSRETERLDYEAIRRLAREHKPALIVAGASAYSRSINFAKFREIADEVGAKLMVDMAHIAGLVATGDHMSPIPYADVVTTTTHKTLRGPRGGLIMTNDEAIAKKIDSSVFPGLQGGPNMAIILAKAVAFDEALEPEFADYITQVLRNAKVMADVFAKSNLRLIAGGTDNHLMLLDVTSIVPDGKVAQDVLEKVGIAVNKNGIPFDTQSPQTPSGIRLGTPAITTRGFKEDECRRVAELIVETLTHYDNETELERIKDEVRDLLAKHPLYTD